MENQLQREGTESPELKKDKPTKSERKRRSRSPFSSMGYSNVAPSPKPSTDSEMSERFDSEVMRDIPPSELSERVGSEREAPLHTAKRGRWLASMPEPVVPKVEARDSSKYQTTPPQKVCLRGHSTKRWSGSMCRCKHSDGTYGCVPIRKTVIRNKKPVDMFMCPKCKYTTPVKER